MFLSLLFGLSTAMAESAYVLNPHQQSLYSGISYGNWSEFESKGQHKKVPDTVTNLFWYSQYSKGISNRMDVTVAFPLQYTSIGASAPDTDMFESTVGLRALQAQSKYLLYGPDVEAMGLFEKFNSIVDGIGRVALVGGLSTGAWNANNRGRLTNIGEGTTDIYVGLITDVNWIIMNSAFDIRYHLRTPTAKDAMSEYPGDDITYSYDLNLTLPNVLYLGGFVDGYYRLSGVDYPAQNVPKIEQFTALQGTQTKVGVKMGSSWEGVGSHLYFAKVIHAKNNPSDEWMIGLGMSFFQDKSPEKKTFQEELKEDVKAAEEVLNSALELQEAMQPLVVPVETEDAEENRDESTENEMNDSTEGEE